MTQSKLNKKKLSPKLSPKTPDKKMTSKSSSSKAISKAVSKKTKSRAEPKPEKNAKVASKLKTKLKTKIKAKVKKQPPVQSAEPSAELLSHIKSVVQSHNSDPTQLLAILREVQEKWRHVSPEAVTAISEELDLPRVHVEGTATFYHFLSRTHRGKYTVYVNTSTTAEIAGAAAVAKAFEDETGLSFGETSKDKKFGLRKTSCIGLCDQEPAILINDVPFTKMTPAKVKTLVAGMKANKSVHQLIGKLGDGNNALGRIHSEVENNIRVKGPVFFTDFVPGSCLKKAMEIGSLDVIELVKKSGLRGRGGAGFPTGQKWGFCRSANSEPRYVMCNVDEGEPGTFKDRVLMTELPQLIFEGMIVAGYAIEAHQGIVYLRGEYAYLKKHLEEVLKTMRSNNLLGKRILGTRFSFDIQIKLGAGAYICGEESALIESAEGKRGQPRNRPPFPVVSGYLGRPTIVNNPETYGCAAKILLNGPDWFRKMGTPTSAGVKLLSIAGDCKKPGIYEVEWGKTVREILKMCGAENVLAVQVGGPSGACISEKQFDRKICYSDLGTGGAFTIFGKHRDLFSIVHNHMEFFVEESCGFCVPCRAGNSILMKTLEKIMVGNGTITDLQNIKDLGKMVSTASRCGLGQSSPNPLISTLQNFSDYYESKVRKDVDYMSQFDMSYAIADSSLVADRQPNLESQNPEEN
ncbi:MAG: NAD(P)H-dependent oxidoreductase subunit E [Bdellovibrionales bacterium]|nr:NAD(P)H-dependent oxidoreductase subunit E [Bdellovibrionales bacterium]